MYIWIWRHLPGGTGAKVASSLLLVLAAAVLLLLVIFPYAEEHLPFTDVTIDG